MKHTLSINNINETIAIGKILGSYLDNSMIIALDGDLGCGKTHFTKGIALGLQIKNTITSPTFSLINEYDQGSIPLYHFDVYRINSLDELYLIGFDDYLKNDGIKIIEWASLIKDALPYDTNYINIYKTNEDNKRIFEFDFNDKYNHIINSAIETFNKEVY